MTTKFTPAQIRRRPTVSDWSTDEAKRLGDMALAALDKLLGRRAP